MILEGKNAIITGARTGIGLATLQRFAGEGANIWAVIHREDEKFLFEIKSIEDKYNVWIKPVYIDLGEEQSISQGLRGIFSEKKNIDILVNAAGIVSPNCLIQMTPIKVMRSVFDVNFFAPVQMMQLVSRIMMRQKKGSIVNVASIAGIDGDMAQLEYAASKAALISATTRFAYELSDYGIRVNAVAPGMTNTKMLGEMDDGVTMSYMQHKTMRRKAEPLEIADVCLFLASEMSSYVNAQTIKVDGGGVNFVSTFNRK